jgi:transposase-like protein
MPRSVLSAKHLHDEEAAYKFLEALIWPEGPVCPHCGGFERISKMHGKATRIGLYKCYQCRQQFRVTVGTVFEASHVPVHKWLQAMVLLASSKKGISSNQLHRTLGVSLKTAWFMSHRLREAMRADYMMPMGGEDITVEADETYIGRVEEPGVSPQRKGAPFTKSGKSSPLNKRVVLALVERGGHVRSFHLENANVENIGAIVSRNVRKESTLHTDEHPIYKILGPRFAKHETVKHSIKEYARGDVTTNTVEGVFSVFKRGMKGTYQHCAEKHLHRYLAEFDFRYNQRIALGVNDQERTEKALKGIVGKPLTYRTTH